jgi:hypothetical protein
LKVGQAYPELLEVWSCVEPVCAGANYLLEKSQGAFDHARTFPKLLYSARQVATEFEVVERLVTLLTGA